MSAGPTPRASRSSHSRFSCSWPRSPPSPGPGRAGRAPRPGSRSRPACWRRSGSSPRSGPGCCRGSSEEGGRRTPHRSSCSTSYLGLVAKERHNQCPTDARVWGSRWSRFATAGSLVLTNSPAEADFSPQPNDVVSTGSDIIQNSFNFLADSYLRLPGYNTTGNGRPASSTSTRGRRPGAKRLHRPTFTAQSRATAPWVRTASSTSSRRTCKLLNPTISLGAGQGLVVRPSGGSGGGTNAIIADNENNIDIGRAPNALTDPNQTAAQRPQHQALPRPDRHGPAADRRLVHDQRAGHDLGRRHPQDLQG